MGDSSIKEQVASASNLTICVSTVDARVLNNADLIQQLTCGRAEVVIVNQITGQSTQNDTLRALDNSPGFKVISTETRGLSKSRNLAMQESKNTWAVLCDDDVLFEDGGLELLEVVVGDTRMPSCGVVVTQLLRGPSRPWRNYSNLSQSIRGTSMKSRFAIQKINSMEMVVNVDNCRDHNLHFRSRWGLGTSPAPGGEEVLFLFDVLRAGLTLRRFGIPLRVHPDESSGSGLHPQNAFVQGATHSMVFPHWFAWGLGLWLAAKHLLRGQVTLEWGWAYFRGFCWASSLSGRPLEP